jgi:hypothetical protein
MRFLRVVSGRRRGNHATTIKIHNHIEIIHFLVFVSQNLKERDLLEDLVIDNIKLNIKQTETDDVI